MPGAVVGFKAAKGETFRGNGTHVTASGSTTPVDITGWTIEVVIKKNASNDDPALLSLSGTVDTGPSGTYHFSITSAQTKALGYGTFSLTIWRTDSGSETQMVDGWISVSAGGKFP